MAKRGRPKKADAERMRDHRIATCLDAGTSDQLRRVSRELGIPVSRIVREAVRQWLDMQADPWSRA